LERREPVLELREVEREIVRPQTGAATDGRRLRWLQVRERERGQIAVGDGEPGERVDHIGDAAADKL
jgi:hypothetical protein